jgi:hypothetical protein
MLAGFVLMHSLLYKVAWQWIVSLGITGTFVIAFSVEAFVSHDQKIAPTQRMIDLQPVLKQCKKRAGGKVNAY